jgi:hypothetical protein
MEERRGRADLSLPQVQGKGTGPSFRPPHRRDPRPEQRALATALT